MAFDLPIAITFFEKSRTHLVTHKYRGRETHADFSTCRRQQLNGVKNYKVLNRESVAAQHGVIMVCWTGRFVFIIKSRKRRKPEQV